MGRHTRPMALLNTHPPERWFRPRRVADRSRCVRYFIRHFLVRGLAIHNLYFSYLSPYESVPRPLGHGRVRRSTSRRARRVRLPFGRTISCGDPSRHHFVPHAHTSAKRKTDNHGTRGRSKPPPRRRKSNPPAATCPCADASSADRDPAERSRAPIILRGHAPSPAAPRV